VVLLNTFPGGAGLPAEKLRQTLAGMNIPHNAPVPGSVLTVSIGLSTVVPEIGSHSRQLIQSADKGLYAARHNWRNQVVVG
jgi:two-component system chemotaxis family response regulator WspR